MILSLKNYIDFCPKVSKEVFGRCRLWRKQTTENGKPFGRARRHETPSRIERGNIMSDEVVRTRFAPSPTGYLHLGGLRTALYTYLFAKKHGGKFILRIEDTDQEREVPGAVDLIYKSMRQAGLTYDEGPDVGGDYGPYIQTQRRDLYPKYAWELVEKGGAYCCFCTKEEIEADRKAAEAKGETYK